MFPQTPKHKRELFSSQAGTQYHIQSEVKTPKSLSEHQTMSDLQCHIKNCRKKPRV